MVSVCLPFDAVLQHLRLTWVCLTLDVGYLFTAAPAKRSHCSLPWTGGISSIALISHASKVMLKILQARLQQYGNCELPDVQAGFRKGRGTKDQIANIQYIIKKAKEFQKNIYFCFIDYAKAFDCVDHNKPWQILKDVGIPDHLTCLLRKLYAGQEATVRTGHGTRLAPNRKRSTSRLYIVTLLI